MLLWILPLAAALVRESRSPELCAASRADQYLERVSVIGLPSVGEADKFDLKTWDSFMETVYKVQDELRKAVTRKGHPWPGEAPSCIWQDWAEHSKWNYRLAAFSTDALVNAHLVANWHSPALAEALLHWSGRKEQKNLKEKIRWKAVLNPRRVFGGVTKEPKAVPEAKPEGADAPQKEVAVEERPAPPEDETFNQKKHRLKDAWNELGTVREDRREYLLYGLYRQALVGDNTKPRPRGSDSKARHLQRLWDAHDYNKGMSAETAERRFFDQLEQAKRAQALLGPAPPPEKVKPGTGWGRWLPNWWRKDSEEEKAEEGEEKPKPKPASEGWRLWPKKPKPVEAAEVPQPEATSGPSFLRLVGILLAGILVAGGIVLAMWSM